MHGGWNHQWPEKHIRDILTLQKQSFAEDNVLECTSLLCRNAYFSFDFVHRNSTPEERTNVCVARAVVRFQHLSFHCCGTWYRKARTTQLATRTAVVDHSQQLPGRPSRATIPLNVPLVAFATVHHSSRSIIVASSLLSAERAALGKTGLATGGLAEDLGAAGADNDGLGVREDGGDGEAAGALDVHEEGAGTGHKGLSGVYVRGCDSGWRFGGGGVCVYLELVLAGLVLRARVEKVDGENLQRCCVSRGCPRCVCTVSASWRRRRCAEFAVVCSSTSSSCLSSPRVSVLDCDVPYWRLPDFN